MSDRFGTAVRRSVMACMVAALGLAGSAPATLLDRGPNLVYDDVLNITWTRQAGDGVWRTWADANTWAGNLVFGGFDDWRLPYASVSAGVGPTTTVADCATAMESACRDNELGYMFYHDLGGIPFEVKTGTQTALGGQQLKGIQPGFWSDTEGDSFLAWTLFFGGGLLSHPVGAGGQGTRDKEGNSYGAWAVRAGDVPFVPEPSSLMLLGVGMLGLVWMRTSRRRR